MLPRWNASIIVLYVSWQPNGIISCLLFPPFPTRHSVFVVCTRHCSLIWNAQSLKHFCNTFLLALLPGGEHCLPSAGQFLISCNVRMWPSPHLMSSSLFLSPFAHYWIRAMKRHEFRLYSHPSEHPSWANKKDEWFESVQCQSDRWEESVDLLLEQRWQRIYSTLCTKTPLFWQRCFLLLLFLLHLVFILSPHFPTFFFPSLLVYA